MRKTTANVWLRAAPKTGKGITVVKKGTTLSLTGASKKLGSTSWYRVKVGKSYGWMVGTYLRKL